MNRFGTKTKIIIACIGLFFIMVATGLYIISSRISPEEIRKMVLENLAKNLPHCEVVLDKLDYSFGLSLRFSAKHFEIALKDDLKKQENIPLQKLIVIDQAEIRVPIWAILTGGGTLEIAVNKPEVYFYALGKDSNNWSKALEGLSKDKEEKSANEQELAQREVNSNSEDTNKQKLKIINFFAKSNINIKFTDINVNYKLADNTQGKVVLSRFLVKNLNLSSPTAFELATDISTTLKTQETLSLKGLLIGHININDLILGKDIVSSLNIKLEDIAFSKFKEKLPNINTDLNIILKKEDGSLNLSISSELLNLARIKSNITIKEKKILVTDIDVKVLVKEALRLFTPSATGQLRVDDSSLALTGKFEMNDGKMNPQIEFSLAPAMNIVVDDAISILAEFNGKINGKSVELFSNNKMLKGNLDAHLATEFDINIPVTEPDKMAPVHLEIVASDLQIDGNYMRGKIYPINGKENVEKEKDNQNLEANKNTKMTKEQEELRAIAESAPAPKLPTVKLNLRLNKIKVGNEELNGTTVVLVQKNKVATDAFNFSYSKGKGNIQLVLELLEKSQKNINFDFSLNNLNLESLKVFMPPQIDVVTGVFTGKVKGTALTGTRPEHLKHDVSFDLSAVNGMIKGIKVGEIVKNVAENFSFLKGKTSSLDQKIDNNFEVLLIKGNARHDKYTLDVFKFIGINKAVEIDGKGNIYPPVTKKEGQMDLSLIDNTGVISAPLEKNVGTKVLPIRLVGPGFSLRPDYLYTTTILAKGALKKNEEKIIGKAKEKGTQQLKKQVEKATDKYIKDEQKKEQVKKMLKGLF